MIQSGYMQLVNPNANHLSKPKPLKSGSGSLLSNKWLWIGAAGLLLWKGKCLLIGGAGLAAGFYLGSRSTDSQPSQNPF